MHEDELPAYMLGMLRIMERYELHEVYWSTLGDMAPITFYVPLLDLFEEGANDIQRITQFSVDVFEAAVAAVAHATDGDATYGPILFACRMRARRPRNARWPVDRRVHELFELTGPERLIEAVVHSTGHRAAAQVLAHPHIPEHDCRPTTLGGPDHCGLCGRPWNEGETSDPHAAG